MLANYGCSTLASWFRILKDALSSVFFKLDLHEAQMIDHNDLNDGVNHFEQQPVNCSKSSIAYG